MSDGGIIGVDPGLASTGYAVIAGSAGRPRVLALGTIRTSPRTPHPERLRAIHDGVAALVAAHRVGAAAVESWFVHPVSRAAMGMAEARGAILVALAGASIEVTEYAPNTIKQAVTGQGGGGEGPGEGDGGPAGRGRAARRPRGRRPRGRDLPPELGPAAQRHPPGALALGG